MPQHPKMARTRRTYHEPLAETEESFTQQREEIFSYAAYREQLASWAQRLISRKRANGQSWERQRR